MGKKGLSLEGKREKILELYYEKVYLNHLFHILLERSA